MRLLHPDTKTPLSPDGPRSLAADGDRFPVVDGIAYLRADPVRRREALRALDAGDDTAALVLLLQDQDPFAPLPPPSDDIVRRVISDEEATFRDIMAALNFGSVADYFAHRWSAPTFLSALALLALYADTTRPLVDVACGTGQVLREVAMRGGKAIGVELVFAKLWLAKRFLGLHDLVAAEAERLPIEVEGGATVISHDALYFLDDGAKRAAVSAMRRVADGGPILAGHCHVAGHPHGGDRAHPLTLEQWAAFLPGAELFDDQRLAEWFVARGRGRPAALRHDGAAAVALAHGRPRAEAWALWEPSGAPLTENPLLTPDGDGLVPVWPSAAFAEEYADAGYLVVNDRFSDACATVAERHARRTLVPLPARW